MSRIRDGVRRVLGEADPLRFVAHHSVNRLSRMVIAADPVYRGRPYYRHPMLQSARLAAKLGHTEMSAIELGVAGGNGLVDMEYQADLVERETGVKVAVYGFDAGSGMPPPVDYRDMPYMWQEGYFVMDEAALRARLRSAELIIGDVGETVGKFCAEADFPPIGFISFDLDFYSSTMAAFALFDAGHELLLPRVACYFDDMVGDVDWAYNEFTGELLAIQEFNDAHDDMKIAPVRGLRYTRSRPEQWHEQIFVAHLFSHPDYCRPTAELTQLPLSG